MLFFGLMLGFLMSELGIVSLFLFPILGFRVVAKVTVKPTLIIVYGPSLALLIIGLLTMFISYYLPP